MTVSKEEERFWPPFEALYDQLETLKLEQASAAERFEKDVNVFMPWLKKGVGGFRCPSEESKKELESSLNSGTISVPSFSVLEDGSVSKSTKEIRVDERIRGAALEVGRFLQLDEMQALYLVDLWMDKNLKQASKTRDVPGESIYKYIEDVPKDQLADDGHVTMKQLSDIAMLYCQERLFLLRSLEDIFWIGEVEDSSVSEVIESVIRELLGCSPDVEQATVDSIVMNLTNTETPAHMAVITNRGRESSLADWAAVVLQGIQQERSSMITLLMILYYHPRKQCTADRFLLLASTFRKHLFTSRMHDFKDCSNPEKLGAMLLLETMVLDVHLPLKQLSQGKQASFPFTNEGTRQKICDEMILFQDVCPVVSPVILTWAGMLVLFSDDKEKGGMYASRASGMNVLKALSCVTESNHMNPAASEMMHLIMYYVLSLVLLAFGLGADTLPMDQTMLIIDAVQTIFKGHSAVCDSFALGLDDVMNQPLSNFLDSCSKLFPANPVPLLRSLSPLCSSTSGAMFAFKYLESIGHLTCPYLKEEIEPIISGDGGQVFSVEGTQLSCMTDIRLEPGTVGSIVTLPMEPDAYQPEMKSSLMYVRWKVNSLGGTSHLMLLNMLSKALTDISNRKRPFAAEEARRILEFYEAVCSSDDVLPLELLRRTADVGTTHVMDFLSILNGAMSLSLSFTRNSSIENPDILSSSLKLCSYFAPYCPTKVFGVLLNAFGISYTHLAKSNKGLVRGVPIFRNLLNDWNQGRIGAYQDVQAVLRLLSVLLQTAYAPYDGILPFALSLVEMCIPYIGKQKSSKEKWDLSASCLTVVRHALLLREVNAEMVYPLHSEQSVLSLIYPLLPPDASYLEMIGKDRTRQEEAEAAEKCCIKWLRLVPILVQSNSESNAIFPEMRQGGYQSVLEKEHFFTSMDGVSSSPATTLLSYLLYPYFGSEDRATVVQCMSCLLNYENQVPITAFLPQQGPKSSFVESCKVIEGALANGRKEGYSKLFSAACDVLCTAVCHHPTLAVLLLPELANHNEGGNSLTAETCSCTRQLMGFAEDSTNLYQTDPSLLNKVLDVVCASITTQTSRNGLLTALASSKQFWRGLCQIIELACEQENEEMELDEEKKLCHSVEHFKAEMKVMDIITAVLCSGPEKKSDDQEEAPVLFLNQFVDSKLPKLSSILLKRYSRHKINCDVLDRFSLVRRVAILVGIRSLLLCLNEEGLWMMFLSENKSFISQLAQACMPIIKSGDVSGHRDAAELLISYVLEDGSLTDDNGLYIVACNSIANLLLSETVTAQDAIEFGNHSTRLLDAGNLPKKIGGAWGKMIDEFEALEVNIASLSQMLKEEESLCECLQSLDALVSISCRMDRYFLSKAVDNVDFESLLLILNPGSEGTNIRIRDELLDLNKGVGLRKSVIAARLGALVSQSKNSFTKQECIEVFERISTWLQCSNLMTETGEDTSYVVSSLLSIGLHCVPKIAKEEMTEDLLESACSMLPQMLSTATLESNDKVSCLSATLSMSLMDRIVPEVMWRDNMHDFQIVNTLKSCIASLTEDSHADAIEVHASRIQAILMLASQITYKSKPSAEVLLIQGICETLLSIGHWISRVLPFEGLSSSESNEGEKSLIEDKLDLSGCYTTQSTRFTPHRVWCSLLSLSSILWSAVPGPKVQALMLRLSISMSARILLALGPPDRGNNRPLTLALVEESKAALGFVCTLSKLEGTWIVNQPQMIGAAREATAAFLNYFASNSNEESALAITREEKNDSSIKNYCPLTSLWFSTPVSLAKSLDLAHNGDAAELIEPGNKFSYQIGRDMLIAAKKALEFHLQVSPEISEKEATALSSKWISQRILQDTIDGAASLLLECTKHDARGKHLLETVCAQCVSIISRSQEMLVIISAQLPADLQENVSSIYEQAKSILGHQVE